MSLFAGKVMESLFFLSRVVYNIENDKRRNSMESFSKKEYLDLKLPQESDSVSDQQRILMALRELGYEQVTFPLPVLRKLYPLCREADFKITVSLAYRGTHWVLTDIEAGDQRHNHYALAVDYGSTTIIMQLVDMNSGTVIGEEKTINGQVTYGTDILTRITYGLESEENMENLMRATQKTFQLLLEELTASTGIHASDCPAMVLSGNTTMIHFLLGLNAWTVFASPYAPVASDPGFFMGDELGIGFRGLVYIIPAASNYIGGDIVSGLLSIGIHKEEGIGLFFDVGTNGELVLGNSEWIIAGAGAAGPALEGYISKFGMRAGDGAIDHVRIRDGKLQYTTIGGHAPKGICGSGIIDLLAQMRLHGWIDIAGKLIPEATTDIVYLEEESQYGVIYAHGEESAIGSALYFAQGDIDQYLDTKAAAYTMVECVLETAGITSEDLSRCYLSGAFPAHSDLESAITIGMFLDIPRERYEVIANTSLDGARTLLLNRNGLQEIHELMEKMYCVQFASVPDFLIRMQAAKFIPHTDMKRYPSVEEALRA